MSSQLRESNFTMDSLGESFPAYTLDESWNGWACPYFTKEQAQRLVNAWQAKGWKAWYEESEDMFVFDFSHDGLDEPDAFPAVEIEGRKLYPIGARCWIWEDVEVENVS